MGREGLAHIRDFSSEMSKVIVPVNMNNTTRPLGVNSYRRFHLPVNLVSTLIDYSVTCSLLG